jgi:hypothetical protein
MARDAIISWTPGQVTRVCDPRPKFGAGSRSLGDLAPGNTIGVSMFQLQSKLKHSNRLSPSGPIVALPSSSEPGSEPSSRGQQVDEIRFVSHYKTQKNLNLIKKVSNLPQPLDVTQAGTTCDPASLRLRKLVLNFRLT